MMARPVFAFRRMAGLSRVIFIAVVVLAGQGIWKACGSFVKRVKEKRLAVKGTGNKTEVILLKRAL